MANTTDLDLTRSTVESPTYRTSAVVTPDTKALSNDTAAVVLADRGKLTKVMVRCAPDSAAAAWLGTTFGRARVTGQGLVIAGVRPDEFWLLGDGALAQQAVSGLFERGVRSIVDLTHGRTLIEVSGPKAAKMLEKVCGLDWSDDMTPPDSATSASVARVTCDIVRAGDRYMISCDRSFGQYLVESLADAAQEFGFTLES